MYYLDQKQFKPALILFSVFFIPTILSLIVALSFLFEVELLIILFAIVALYLMLILVLWRISVRKTHCLSICEDSITINYPNVNDGKGILKLSITQIKKIDYYKITSLSGWMMLFNYVYPKSVFITYSTSGTEKTDFVGYMDLHDLQKIANSNQIELIIH